MQHLQAVGVAESDDNSLFSQRSVEKALDILEKTDVDLSQACLRLKGYLIMKQIHKSRPADFSETKTRIKESIICNRKSYNCPFLNCNGAAQNLIRHISNIHGASPDMAFALKETINNCEVGKGYKLERILEILQELKKLAGEEDVPLLERLLKRIGLVLSFSKIFENDGMISNLLKIVRGDSIPASALPAAALELIAAPQLTPEPSKDDTQAVDNDDLDNGIERDATLCAVCSKYVPTYKARQHLRVNHKFAGGELNDEAAKMQQSSTKKILSRAPKRGENFHSLIIRDGETPNPLEIVMTSPGPVSMSIDTLREISSDTNNVKTKFPKLNEIFEMLKGYMGRDGSSITDQRAIEYVSIILLYYCIRERTDLTPTKCYDHIHAILNLGAQLLGNRVKLTTAKKILKTLNNLNSLFGRIHHRSPATFDYKYDSKLIKDAVDDQVKK